MDRVRQFYVTVTFFYKSKPQTIYLTVAGVDRANAQTAARTELTSAATASGLNLDDISNVRAQAARYPGSDWKETTLSEFFDRLGSDKAASKEN